MRIRRGRRRYARFPAFDLWSDLGPGDPGYRLRPGRSGFDPWEMYMEYARMLGTLLKGAFTGRLGPHPIASLVLLLAFLIVYVPSVVAWVIASVLVPPFLDAESLFSGAYGLAVLLFVLLVVLAIRRRRHP